MAVDEVGRCGGGWLNFLLVRRRSVGWWVVDERGRGQSRSWCRDFGRSAFTTLHSTLRRHMETLVSVFALNQREAQTPQRQDKPLPVIHLVGRPVVHPVVHTLASARRFAYSLTRSFALPSFRRSVRSLIHRSLLPSGQVLQSKSCKEPSTGTKSCSSASTSATGSCA